MISKPGIPKSVLDEKLAAVDLSALAALGEPSYRVRQPEEKNLEMMIARAIQRQTNGAIQDLHVEVTEQSIVLSGECASYYGKQQSQETARQFCEQRILLNEINVRVKTPR
jgi:hypothetical protein